MRVKRGVKARKRRKKILKLASGFVGRAKNTIKNAKNKVDKALQYRFVGRKVKKRDFRSLWITRISAAAKINGMTYSSLIKGLKTAGVEIDRKVLSELGAINPEVFAKIVETAKEASQQAK